MGPNHVQKQTTVLILCPAKEYIVVLSIKYEFILSDCILFLIQFNSTMA